MPTVSAQPMPPKREPSFIDVDVLELEELRKPAIDHYISLDPARKEWTPAMLARMEIRTECRWGRVQMENDAGKRSTFLLNEAGEGPKTPLSRTNVGYIALFASMKRGDGFPGFFETTPFTKVPIDETTAANLKAKGLVKLEEFIKVKGAQFEATYEEWKGILSPLRETMRRAKANKAAAKQAPSQQIAAPDQKIIPIKEGDSETEGEQGPRARV